MTAVRWLHSPPGLRADLPIPAGAALCKGTAVPDLPAVTGVRAVHTCRSDRHGLGDELCRHHRTAAGTRRNGRDANGEIPALECGFRPFLALAASRQRSHPAGHEAQTQTGTGPVQRPATPLLNIGRMAPGRADYYLTAVARGGDGVEGYYLARGEEPGRWLGHGAEQLGLAGEVTAEQLRAVLDAHHPDTGQQLASHPARKVPGFDHTFRAPKSVSLLWALSDRATAEQVVLAHDAAVDAAIGYLQRAAGFSRRGAGGAETLKVDGFVAAAFRHRTSRANDPLLHTHVLVANLPRTCDDGIWRTLDSRKLFAHAKTAGVLYQAQLRHELTTRLGVGGSRSSTASRTSTGSTGN
jgi:conjugative relaxase-like TrwC/TraI family protein